MAGRTAGWMIVVRIAKLLRTEYAGGRQSLIMERPTEDGTSQSDPAPAAIVIPAGFHSLPDMEAVLVAQHLGYVREERFIIAAYHPEADAVIWKDGRQSGFGEGGWDFYFQRLLPSARRVRADLTDQQHVGQDVLVLDRQNGTVYIAPRPCAEEFLATAIGQEPPHRRCMCARPLSGIKGCESCPARHRDIPSTPVVNSPKVDTGGSG